MLLLVGEEVSPLGRDHYLAFGIDEEIRHRARRLRIARAVRDAGGFGFAAHPFSQGSARFKRPGMPFGGLDCDALDGIELWSFANDTGESTREHPADDPLPRRARPHARPPSRAQHAQLGRALPERRVVAIGGLDAHQFGKRIGPVVPVRVMAYHRSFRYIRTHVLCSEPRRTSSSRIASSSSAPCGGPLLHRRGFRGAGQRFSLRGRRRADGRRGARGPAHAAAYVRRWPPACGCCATAPRSPTTEGTSLDAEVEQPGVYRVEALRDAKGRERTWILSNPVYLR